MNCNIENINTTTTTTTTTTNNNSNNKEKNVKNTIKPMKRYQLWKGSQKFLCNGRLMLGVNTGHLKLSIFLTFITWLLYAFLIVPFLQNSYILFIAITFLVVNESLLLITAFTEPGIIPRRNKTKLNINVDMKSRGNYCSICKIIRPNRCRHCRHCDACIDVFDHHCPWTGTCIGIRNYCYFFLFLTSVLLGSIFILLTTIFGILGYFEGLITNRPLLRIAAFLLIFLWSIILTLLVGSLFCFHIFLIIRKQTTCEYLRNTPLEKKKSIFGCLRDICYSTDGRCYISKLPTKLLPMWQKVSINDSKLQIHRIEESI
jgi:palmitoyltransferase ZDHHC9/14/18